jgi:hypothetical protein
MAIIIIFLLIIIAVLLFKSPDKCKDGNAESINNDERNLVGIYHTNNWNNNREATLRLNDDKTCYYPMTSDICKWSLSSEYIINVELSIYRLRYTDEEKNTKHVFDTKKYKNKIDCEEARLNRWKDETNSLKCVEEKSYDEVIEIIDNGLLVNNHIFTKIKQ